MDISFFKKKKKSRKKSDQTVFRTIREHTDLFL